MGLRTVPSCIWVVNVAVWTSEINKNIEELFELYTPTLQSILDTSVEYPPEGELRLFEGPEESNVGWGSS